VRGPNGGYVAAVLLRALTERLDDPTRTPRSLTVHYTAPPAEGFVEIETVVERSGRSLTTLSVRMTQEGRLLALGLAAFSAPRNGPSIQHARMPDVAAPELCTPVSRPTGGFRLPIHERYHTRWAVGGPPFSGAPEALCGGWIRMAEPRVPDALAVAAFADAFPPAPFSWATPQTPLGPAPTIDLTVHFRTALPLPGAGPEDFVLAVFRAREARDGFFEEDGEIWTPDGVLLAQSRQLAILT
jgi:acyl-CoA thioesterase